MGDLLLHYITFDINKVKKDIECYVLAVLSLRRTRPETLHFFRCFPLCVSLDFLFCFAFHSKVFSFHTDYVSQIMELQLLI